MCHHFHNILLFVILLFLALFSFIHLFLPFSVFHCSTAAESHMGNSIPLCRCRRYAKYPRMGQCTRPWERNVFLQLTLRFRSKKKPFVNPQ